MGVSVSLATAELSVEPGEPTVCEVVVVNTGTVVDHLDLSVVGDIDCWARVEPTTLNLFPNQEATVELVLEPPRSAEVLAGSVVFGVRVASQEDVDGSAVAEGVVTVKAFTELDAELVPRTAHGRRSARHELAVDNRGNKTVLVQVFAEDPDDQLKVRALPESFEAPPGSATFLKLKVRPRRRFLRGPNRTIPFQVHVCAEDDRVDLDGTMVQEQLLPPWLLPALLAVVTGAATLLVLYFTVLKPNVTTAAREAAAGAAKNAVDGHRAELSPTLAAVQRKADQADRLAEVAAKAAGVDPKVIEDIQASATPTPTPAPGGGTATGGLATDFRIQTSVQPGKSGTAVKKVEDDRVLALTDIILQNPGADTGTLELRRGENVLLRVNLENFRDLDYHFVRPIEFGPKSQVVLSVDCRNPIPAPCTAAAYFTGNTRPAA
ncbi:hypothetical protein [Allokutzneria sp. NRRL B-24872]|uniref:COG1470 family protein n=1 Tax=Allokutzneria sp. NRRL B-24872 TaxID=1137961 RepID=UPI000A3B8837|nr:hypothetical protein [Allokutzneria sp. NRRL B-24872]